MLLLWQTGSTPSKVNVVLPTREAAAARNIGGESHGDQDSNKNNGYISTFERDLCSCL